MLASTCLNWLSWATGITLPLAFLPGWVPMQPWTALWLAMLAAAMLLQSRERPSPIPVRAARTLATVAAGLVCVVLAEYSGVGVPGFDLWWFGDAVGRAPRQFPGRPSLQTTLPMLALSCAAVLLRVRGRGSEWLRFALLAFGTFIPAAALAAYALRANPDVQFQASADMAPMTALAMLVLAFAAMHVRPDCRPISWFLPRPDTASTIRLVAVLLGFPLSVWAMRAVLVELGASSATGLLLAEGLSTIAAGIGVYVTSRRQQELLADRLALADDLKAASDRYRLVAENSSDAIFLSDSQLTLNWASPSATLLLGWTHDQFLGRSAMEFIHPDDAAQVKEVVERSWATGKSVLQRYRWRLPGGEYLWVESAGRFIDDDGHGQPARVVELRDIDAEVKARQALEQSESRYRLLAENASDLVVSVGADRLLEWVSPSVTALLEYLPEELVGRPASLFIHPEDRGLVEQRRQGVVEGRPAKARVRLHNKSGEIRWCEIRARPVIDDERGFLGTVIDIRNIDDEVAAQQAFQHEVDFDGLTGLPRRDLALQRMRGILDEQAKSGWALLCLGVSGMTQINQAYTYSAGDEVLKTVADRLVETVGAHDRVARIAGDEFVILEPDLITASGAANAAERILEAVGGPVPFGTTRLEVAASIGIAMASDGNAEELLRDATAAMRQAALRGPGHWEFLDGNIAAQTREALRIQSDLREALSGGRIEAWFMPVVELPARALAGYEALIRWRLDDGSFWGPDLFLGIAERTGLILALDKEMLRQTLAAAARTSARITFGYNVSAGSLASDEFREWALERIAESGVDPRRLKFEITETALLHVTDGVKRTIQVLADIGVDWWVDDFGTGFSSISHLRDLPIAGLKLDRSFTSGVTDPTSQAAPLALGLLGLARGLELVGIAEGVECVEQEQLLVQQGWHFAQGWLYGMPSPHLP